MNFKFYLLSVLLGLAGAASAQTATNLVSLGAKLTDVSAVTSSGAQLMLYQTGDGNNRVSWLTIESASSGANLKLVQGNTGGTAPALGSNVADYLFTVESQTDGTIALKTANGEYVSGEVTTNSTKENHIATSATNKATFKVTAKNGGFLFNRQGLTGSNYYLNSQSHPYVTFWNGDAHWSQWEVYKPTLTSGTVRTDSFTINNKTGVLTSGGTTKTWNNTWTASANSLLPSLTLVSTANDMQNGAGDGIDMRAGMAKSSSYTINLPEGYELVSYTINGKALQSNQTVTPAGKTALTFTTDSTSQTVAVGGGARTATFTLSGENSGLLATIGIIFRKLPARDLVFKVKFNGDVVASARGRGNIGAAPTLPDSLSMGNFATFAFEPAVIADNTDTVVATMTWNANAPIQFVSDLSANDKLYTLNIRNDAGTFYFNYAAGQSPNIVCANKADGDNGLWTFTGNPYAARIINKAAGDTLQLASPTTNGVGNTGGDTYAVLSKDFTANPNNLWRIYPATQAHNGNNLKFGSGFFLANKEGKRLNVRKANDGVQHLAYWTDGYDDGSTFHPTQATTTATVGATVQGFRTTGLGNEVWLTRTIVDAPLANDGGKVTQLKAQLKSGSADLVDEVRLYAVTSDTLTFDNLRNPEACRVGTIHEGLDKELVFNIADNAINLKRGQTLKLFLTAKVKANATLYSEVDAKVTSITIDGKETTVNGDPDGSAKIFKTQKHVFLWHTDGYAVYRIPAMTRAYTKDGDNTKRLVAVIDGTNDGFQQNGHWNPNPDPGFAPINVFYKKSDDNGLTWSKLDTLKLSSRTTGSNTNSFGDPAIVRTKSGKLIIMTCATDKTFWDGQKYPYMFVSTNNGDSFDAGKTINTSDILTDSIAGTKGFGGYSWFVTSGRGICTKSGRIMFLINYLTNDRHGTGNVNDALLYSDDEGEHWTISKNLVWSWQATGGTGNESKLVQRPDGKILASIRRGGDRGFNLSTDETGLNWQGQWLNSGLKDSGVNADVIAYGDSMLIHTIINGANRTNLDIFVSSDNGQTWTKKFNIQQTYAAYSTMEILDNGDLAILYEDGSYHYGDNQYDTNIIHYYDINYVTIPRETIQQWGKVTAFVDPVLTGVSEFSAPVRRAASAQRYNLQGQRVGNSYKGVVIENGRKFVVK